MSDIKQQSLRRHKDLKGKLQIKPKASVDNMDDLAVYYSPGVGAVSDHVAKNVDQTRDYTGTNNSVAIVSDGSAVLGLGNIGPEGALPVMEGKAMLFNRFAGIDGYPIVLNAHTVDEIVATTKAIAPSFGGINLEDIKAPICFDVESQLKSAGLGIPVFHDDQHGTAIVVLAGLINALKIKNYTIGECRIVISGAGAAGIAIADILHKYGAEDILVLDSKGIINSEREGVHESKVRVAGYNAGDVSGDLASAVSGAHVFIGVSRAGLLTQDLVRSMATDPIIFALANPDPEIMPEDAYEAGALVIATGRSDYPNQVNNAVAFPGIFRGALDNQVSEITDEHKVAAAEVVAGLVDNPTREQIIPNVFDERLVPEISKVIV